VGADVGFVEPDRLELAIGIKGSLVGVVRGGIVQGGAAILVDAS
jgi:hypothetical protein